jgi:uncharacterized protein YgiM (DUF1202 family)
VFIVVSLILAGCSRSLANKASTSSYIAGSEAELRDGSKRVADFKQELLNSGFRIVSSTNSDSWEQVTLKADYGELKDVEIVLRADKHMEMKEPHVEGRVQANVASRVAEQEFDRLDARLKSAIQGK